MGAPTRSASCARGRTPSSTIDGCPLFSPGMAGAISAARALSGDLRGLMKPLDIGVTATLDGLDVDLRGSGPLGRPETQKLTRAAKRSISRASPITARS